MKTIKVTITGKTPLICNKFTDAKQLEATSGIRSSLASSDRGTPKDIAESKLYINLSGQPVIPQPNLFKCIMEAGKFFKAGKKQITTKTSSLLPACVEIDGIDFLIQSKQGWQVDTRPVRIPSTGGRILAHRPIFHDWSLSFEIGIEETEINEKLMRDLVDAAGSKIGLGDFRPDCKGPYGKFVVTKWK